MGPERDESTVSLPGQADDPVLVHLEFSAGDLGISPPPTRCHIRAYESPRGWVLLLWSPQAPTEALRAWVKAQVQGAEIAFGTMGDRTVGFDCGSLPETWERLFGLFDADHLIMEPDGTTLTHIEGPRDEVGQFLSGLDLQVSTKPIRDLSTPDDRMREDILTETQEQAIGRAAALGFFSVPREIQVGELADRLGTSKSALSELLRRAQARLVFTYLDNQLGGIEAILELEESAA